MGFGLKSVWNRNTFASVRLIFGLVVIAQMLAIKKFPLRLYAILNGFHIYELRAVLIIEYSDVRNILNKN